MGQRRLTPVHVFGIVWCTIMAAVLLAVLFAPRKPPAPPASEISYERKPDGDRALPTLPDDDRPFPRREQKRASEEAPVQPAAAAAEARFGVSGTVFDAKTGGPVAHAVVSCRSTAPPAEEGNPLDMPRWQTFSDEEGRYVLRLGDPGDYSVDVACTGYVPQAAQNITLAEDQRDATLDFRLSKGASISGRVTESGSNQGAVEVEVNAVGPVASSAVTDKDGRYELAGLTPGNYSVTLALRDTPYLASGTVPTRNATVAAPTQEVRNIDFKVEAAGQVWGYVLTQKRDAIAGADVIVSSGDSIVKQAMNAAIKQAPPAHGRSDDGGYYEVSGIPLNQEWRLYATTDKHCPQLSAPFVLTNAHRSARIDLFLAPGTTIRGRVVSTDRTPLPEADVACIPKYSNLFSPMTTPQAFRPASSDEDGRFEITDLPAGEYQVVARKDGYKFAARGEPVYPDGFSDIEGLEVVLAPVEVGESSVYGTVTDGLGAPLSGVDLALNTVGFEDMGSDSRSAQSDSRGQYAFTEVRPGVLILEASKDGFQRQTISNVRLDEPTDIVMQAGATIAGTVLVRETSEPVTAFSVQASPLSASGGMPWEQMANLVGSQFTDPSGRFELQVSPGEYSLRARASGLTPSAATEVSVEAGETTSGVVLYLAQAGAAITGRVITPSGGSPAGALVWLTGSSDAVDALAGVAGAGSDAGVQVGEDGEFAFTQLAADSYVVSAKLQGYAQAQSGPIALGESQQMSGIELRLGAGQSLSGYVAINGVMIPGAMVTLSGNGITEMAATDANGQYRIDNIPPGLYMAAAVSLNDLSSVTDLIAPQLARIEIVEGQDAVHNFGEPTNTALEGLCTPAPRRGETGIALLLMPGATLDLSGINLFNIASLYQRAGGMASAIAGFQPIQPDGFFRMDNLVEGDFTLQVFYGSYSNVLSGTFRPAYTGIVQVRQGETTMLELPVTP